MSQQVVVIPLDDLKKTIELVVCKVFAREEKYETLGLEKNVLILSEAASYVKMAEVTFRKHLAKNEVKGYKVGRSWRFFVKDLDSFLKANRPKTIAEIEKEIDDRLSK